MRTLITTGALLALLGNPGAIAAARPADHSSESLYEATAHAPKLQTAKR
jgi:hypothetical protein